MTNAIVEHHKLPADYLMAARDMARKGLAGAIGDPLPMCMNAETVNLINRNIPRFQMWVSIKHKEMFGW